MGKPIEVDLYTKCKAIHHAVRAKNYEGHNSFEQYCQSVFNISKRHGYYLSQCFIVLDNLKNYFTHRIKNHTQKSVIPGSHNIFLPNNYKLVKPLLSLTPKQQVEAWLFVIQNVEYDNITSYDVVWAVYKVTGRLEYQSKSNPNYNNELPRYRIDPKFIAAIDMEAKSESKEPELVIHEILDRYFNGFFERMKRRNIKRSDDDKR